MRRASCLSDPYLALLALECFIQNDKARYLTRNHVEQYLAKKAKFQKIQAWEAVNRLLEDKILIKDNTTKSNNKSQLLRFFGNDEIEVLDQDSYCFECFTPGELIKCRDCTRVFHLSCIRRYPERPNYLIPPTNAIAEFADESDIEASTSSSASFSAQPNVGSPAASAESTIPKMRNCKVVLVDMKYLKREILNDDSIERKYEFPDVTFMGQVRPPTRQRLGAPADTPIPLKNELTTNENEVGSNEKLCTCCRLLEKGQLTQPPNLLSDEMHHLLSYTFKLCRKWIKRDVNKQIESRMIPEKHFSLLVRKLFVRQPIMTLDRIGKKLHDLKYKLLVEIHKDFLEYQFVIGVLFGSRSLEFDYTKFLVRDLSYDLAEIRRCPDCFRHSSDQLTPFWFALPCVQRHELVFAKCPGYAYWPAKVIRVLQHAEKYDVRFFGGNHERSLVKSVNIRPIDSLNIPFPKLTSFKTAMNELQCYRTLSEFSPSRFGFHADREDIQRIIDSVIGAIDICYKTTQKKQQRRTSSKPKRIQTISNSSLISENGSDSEPASSGLSYKRKRRQTQAKGGRGRAPPKLLRLENTSIAGSPVSAISSLAPTPVHTNSHAVDSFISVEQHVAEMNALRDQLNELHQRELVIAKLKPYCVQCLQPAKFLCCIQAWYCSPVCQRQHWYEGHEQHCDNFKPANNEALI